MSQTGTKDQQPGNGYAVETTPEAVKFYPDAYGQHVVIEVGKKGKTMHVVKLKYRPDPAKDVADSIFHDTGSLNAQNFRDKIVAAATAYEEKHEGRLSDFAAKLDKIADGVERHFAERVEDAKEDKERVSTDELKGTPYAVLKRGRWGEVFFRIVPCEDDADTEHQLTNFTARVVGDEVVDDGAETARRFTVEAAFKKRTHIFEVSADEFDSLRWVVRELGPKALVFPNQQQHARAAIQLYGPDVEVDRVYAHTGIRKVDDLYVYLHAAGVISGGVVSLCGEDGQSFSKKSGTVDHDNPDGQAENPPVVSVVSPEGHRGPGENPGIKVRLTGKHAGRVLPELTEGNLSQLAAAVRCSLSILELAAYEVTAPLLGGVGRAILGDSDFSVFVVGRTGAGKTALAALVQQHFGATMGEKNLLSWESTANSLELELFALKDQIAVIDDFVPRGSGRDRVGMQRTAARVLQGKGNQSSRGRANADLSLRPDRPPRALVIATGEELPDGESLRARLFAVALGKTNGKPDLDFEMLTGLQEQANKGVLALAAAGYVGWVLARGYEEVQSERKRLHHSLRAAAAAMGENEHHKKTAHVVAELAVGLAFYLRYAVDVGAVDVETAQSIWAKSSNALHEGAAAQAAYQAAAEPITRFRDLLASALASGKANLGNAADPMGEPPPKYRAQAGWEYVDQVGWKPRGACIGLIGEDESVFLDPSASIQVASTISRDTAEPFARSKQAVSTDLVEGGHIVARDSEKRGQATVRKVFKGRGRLAYWAVSPRFLWPSMSANTDHADHGGETPHGNAENRGQWPPFSGLKG